MSERELRRVEVLARVCRKQLLLVDAGRLMRVSYRQAKRLWKRYRKEGATGLKHRSAGRRSNRAFQYGIEIQWLTATSFAHGRSVKVHVVQKFSSRPVGPRFDNPASSSFSQCA